jgi:GT2 family glycosyltransferase
MANPFAAIKALFGTRQSLGYGHLEKVVKEYSQWRGAHPEADKIDDALQALNPLARAIVPSSSPNEQSGTKPELAAPTEPIEFKAHDEIDISIIIPVYNQFHFTIACLASIQKHQEAERFEVIVVDDCSTDATPDAISKLAGVIYLRNESNRGFISSCNLGAAKARGEFLVFLNNDTVVTPGWLRALHETFSFEPRAGLVGSKLVYPDGRLQEAGGIIWRDGSGWNWGKFGDAQKPEYNFLREVDYCSAASLMIPKSLFESLGGFDTQYAPCYYEDTDLAFKVRRQGYKVLYQPLSQVIHYEGATGGTDISAGAKKYQEINRATFTTAWAGELEKKPENGDITFLEALQPGQKHILVIDHHLPLTDRDAGSLRMFHIVVLLRKLGHRVTFLPDNVADIPPYGDELRKRGVEVIVHPFTRSVQQFVEEEAAKFDVIILSRCDFAQKHIAQVRRHAPESRIIFDTVDLHHLRQQREAELTQDPLARLSADERKQQEYDIIDQADETWVVSNFERELLHDERPEKSVQVVPTIVEVRASATPFSLRRDFLFIGGFQHTPNIDAVLYFAREIFPLVHERLPAARFYIIGDKAPPEVINLTSEHIIVTGLQPDLRPYFDSVKLSVAPLRYGAGVKGKINQSMAFGVPVVATSLAVEGMELTEGEDVLVADLPNEFARAVVELYENEKLWRMLSENGMEKTRSLYSVETAEEILRRIFSADHAQPESALNRTARQTLETAKEMSLSKPS